MAWVRTATSLITFGFTLYKFFFYLQEQEPAKHAEQLLGPRHVRPDHDRHRRVHPGGRRLAASAADEAVAAQDAEAPFSLSLVLAALIAVLGILGFITAVFRE